ncbi:MAG: hypothetical protein EOO43_09205 [Flavobacterium sp.]|nr:MAG: hypothetical protein EOO43_09205 [Flavobacterium sp.]
MTEEEIIKRRNEEFMELLERTKQIKTSWEIYEGIIQNKNTDKKVSKRMYVDHFLMASILDAFMYREALNLQELLTIVINHQIPQFFVFDIPAKKIDLIIANMIKLGYLEVYRKEQTIVPILQLTELGITILQQRTLQNLALTSFYSYQSYKLDKRAINLSLLAILISIIAIILSAILTSK